MHRPWLLRWEPALNAIRHRQCCGKARHTTADGAERVGRGHGARLKVYYCVFCNGFHLGGKQKNSGRKAVQNIEVLLTYDFAGECVICEDLKAGEQVTGAGPARPCECKRCGERWHTQKPEGQQPRYCPACKSRRWEVPKKTAPAVPVADAKMPWES